MAAMYKVKLFIVETVIEKCPNIYCPEKCTYYNVFTVQLNVVLAWSYE